MKVKIMLAFSCLLVFLVWMTKFDAQTVKKPTYEELFEQQMDIYETKRYIERNEKAQKKIKKEVPILQSSIESKQVELTEKMEDVKPILMKMYGGESMMWADLFLELKNVEDMMTVYHISKDYTEKEMGILHEVNEDLQALAKEEAELKGKQKELKNLKEKLESELAQLQSDEAVYKNQLGLMDNVEEAKKEVEKLIYKWETKGIKSFKTLFKVMSKGINDMPETVSKDSVNLKGLFTYEVVLKDKELNEMLVKQDDVFENIRFSFDDNELRMNGTYEGLSFDASGYYELIKDSEMRFHITSLYFQDVKLPQVTAVELEEAYDLSFYPSEVIEGIKVKEIQIDEGELKVQVSF